MARGLFGLVSLSIFSLVCGATGCSSDKGETAPSSEPAAKVIELSGSVHATRDSSGEKRALSQNAVLFADDVIETGKGASAVIRLAHNNADWQLGEGLKMRVDKSTAWRAPKRSAAPLVADKVKDESFAAGRHSEREAGEGAATARPNEAPPPAQTAPADPTPSAETVRAKKSAPKRKGAKRRPKTKSSGDSGDPLGAGGFAIKGSSGGSGGSKSGRGSGGTRNSATRGGDTSAPGSSTADPEPARDPVILESEKTRGTSSSAARGLIESTIKACASKHAADKKGQVTATITVDSSGKIVKVGIAAPRGWNDLQACVRTRLTGKKVTGVPKRATGSVRFK